MQSTTVNFINPSQTKIKFKNKPKNKREEYIEKYNYINAKTENLSDLSTSFLILALFCNVHNINFKKKLNTAEKIGIGALIASGITITANCIKRYKLSKEYDKEIKNDSKNYA